MHKRTWIGPQRKPHGRRVVPRTRVVTKASRWISIDKAKGRSEVMLREEAGDK